MEGASHVGYCIHHVYTAQRIGTWCVTEDDGQSILQQDLYRLTSPASSTHRHTQIHKHVMHATHAHLELSTEVPPTAGCELDIQQRVASVIVARAIIRFGRLGVTHTTRHPGCGSFSGGTVNRFDAL